MAWRNKKTSNANNFLGGLNEGFDAFHDAYRNAQRDEIEKQRLNLEYASKGFLLNPETGLLEKDPEAQQRKADDEDEKRFKILTDAYGKAGDLEAKGKRSKEFADLIKSYRDKKNKNAIPMEEGFPSEVEARDDVRDSDSLEGGLLNDAKAGNTAPQAASPKGLIDDNSLFQTDPNYKSPEQRQIESEERKEGMRIAAEARAAKRKEEAEARKPTQDQSRAATYAARIDEGMKGLEELRKTGYSRSDPQNMGLLRSNIDFPIGSEWIRSKVGESDMGKKLLTHDQIENNIVTAIIRPESGATVPEKELERDKKKYFERPGDPPETIANKKRALEAAIAGVKAEAGPAYQNVKNMIEKSRGLIDPQANEIPKEPSVAKPKLTPGQRDALKKKLGL